MRREQHEHTIAVALHGIEPATFERCALIRDWLDDHGVDRVTLLVIPARDLHPIGERSPAMVRWLGERECAGDAIAQHGFQHVRGPEHSRAQRLLAGAPGRSTGEFSGLDGEETRRAVHAGWRVLKLAGITPEGFVAPAYAYTPALRSALAPKFRWWAGLLRVQAAHAGPRAGPRAPLTPAWSLATGGLRARTLSPPLVRMGSLLARSTLRVDVHPAHLRHPRHILALEWVLEHNGSRRAITYGELADVGAGEAYGTWSSLAGASMSVQPEGLAVNSDGGKGFTAGSAA